METATSVDSEDTWQGRPLKSEKRARKGRKQGSPQREKEQQAKGDGGRSEERERARKGLQSMSDCDGWNHNDEPLQSATSVAELEKKQQGR